MMKVWRARRRISARRASGGFTLLELMVVVTLIAILAVLAIPSFAEARNDRAAFDYARQYQQILMQGRARAAGTGAAHLALLTPGGGGRGIIRLYAALDGTTTAGPNPVSSCKLNPTQWAAAVPEPSGGYGKDQIVDTTNTVRFIDFADLNRGGINDDMDLRARLWVDGVALGNGGVIAICTTPAGVTYLGSGASAANAIAAMQIAPPFTGTAEVHVQRHRANNPIGLERIVQISGGATPRLRSQ